MDKKMQTFLTVCETMNSTRAAEKLYLSQPAVTAQIHALEKEYGITLFNYSRKKLTLTPQGEILLKAGYAMRSDEKTLRRRLLRPDPDTPHIHFGVTKTIGEYVIARPLARYLQSQPDASVTMEIENTKDLLRMLEEGTIQFALIEGYFDHEEFETLLYDTVPFVPVCAAGHRFAREPEKLSDLFSERLIIREPGSGTRRLLENQLTVMGYRVEDFQRHIQVGGMHAILQMLEEDAGISFLYYPAARDQIRAGRLRLITLSDFHVRHDFTFLWEAGSIYRDRYRQICQSIKAYAAGPDI